MERRRLFQNLTLHTEMNFKRPTFLINSTKVNKKEHEHFPDILNKILLKMGIITEIQ